MPHVESLEAVSSLLRVRGRRDLAGLLSQARVEFQAYDTPGIMQFPPLTIAEIYAQLPDYDSLSRLPNEDNRQIFASLVEIWPPDSSDMQLTRFVYRLDTYSRRPSPPDTEQIIGQVERLRDILISVATGGPRIDSVNDEYRQTYLSVNKQLNNLGLRNPIPYTDLWLWYGKWSSGDLPTYASRRTYISGLIEPLQVQLRERSVPRGAEVFPEPTGWARVDRTLDEARTSLESARTEEQFQAVGLYCREVLISLAQTVFDPDRHPPLDDVEVSRSDAKRMLDRYLAAELAGGSNAIARKNAKASLDLANQLQHERTAAFRKAALCAEATTSVVNIIAILSGIRDPVGETSKHFE